MAVVSGKLPATFWMQPPPLPYSQPPRLSRAHSPPPHYCHSHFHERQAGQQTDQLLTVHRWRLTDVTITAQIRRDSSQAVKQINSHLHRIIVGSFFSFFFSVLTILHLPNVSRRISDKSVYTVTLTFILLIFRFQRFWGFCVCVCVM